MKKRVVSLLLTGLMAVTAVACGGKKADTNTGSNSEDGIKLTVWGPQEDQDANWLQDSCEAFAAAHPDYNLTFEYGVCSEGDAGKTVTQDPTAAADVFMFANDQIPMLVDAGALAEFGGDTLDQIKKDNDSAVVTSVTYKDGVYGVPFTSNTWFMYYDKSVFSEDDVKSMDTMLEKGKVSFPLTNSWYVASFYLANGCTMFGADGSDEAAGFDFGGDKGAAVTKYLVNLAKNPNFVNDADGAGIAGLKDKSVNAIFSGSWDYGNVKEILGDNIGIATVPTIKIDGKDCQMKAFAGSKAIGVNANSKNMKAAVELAAYLGGADAQTTHYTARSIVPTIATLDLAAADGADMAAVQQKEMTSTYSILQPVYGTMGQYWGPAETMGKAIVAGDVTEANAAEQTETMNKSLNTASVE